MNKKIETFEELLAKIIKLEKTDGNCVRTEYIKSKYSTYWEDGEVSNNDNELKIIECSHTIKFQEGYYWILDGEKMICGKTINPQKIYDVILAIKNVNKEND